MNGKLSSGWQFLVHVATNEIEVEGQFEQHRVDTDSSIYVAVMLCS